jgi:hypothetical protein
MQLYKRNQVEEAISRTLGERSKKPSAELLARIKRLLDTDRAEKSKRSHSAFVSLGSEGQGHENGFSNYDAFAILLGLRMLAIGWSQTRVVKILMEARRDLERAYPKFRAVKRDELVPRAGMVDISGPAIGVLFSSYDRAEDEMPKILIAEDAQELMSKTRQKLGQSISVFGLGNTVEQLEHHLAQVPPRKRGRG